MTQPTRLLLALACLTSMAAAQTGQSIVENIRTLSFDCQNGYVRVEGNRNVLTLTGSCTVLTVTGNRNTIRVATVGAIVLEGNDNKVTWSKALKGSRPTVDNPGSRNSISHK